MLFDPSWIRTRHASLPHAGQQISMGASSMSASKSCKVANLDMEGVVRFLFAAFPRATAQHTEAVTGVSSGTVENWLRGRAKPSGDHLGAMVDAFGPAFVSAAFPSTRQWTAPLIARSRLAEIARELSALAEAAE
ncbi:helix-turn-helix transcriptional regulator [Nitratireductor sp. StC3]|uniref:helix-turn-helix domain-containing protein n=1 Tax=Nitratireductor sp. StC3 TaxID=2126741 RepID=UPI000D0E1A5A|nr:helix-turn-helix transcriptional regulator [Nitratireductor sp. StC3]PSM18244.1 hypothetical protein C7T96_10270 [Nitratireductor sp. StC3]